MTIDSTSNPQSGLDWEDVCLDPHQAALEEGKAQGRVAGALAGFRDGQALGQTKGVEFGLEVGFYQGVLTTLSQDGTGYCERVEKSLHHLKQAIDDFPTDAEMFAAASDLKETLAMGTTSMTFEPPVDTKEDDSEDPSKFDVLNKMQRIRARFKLLMVQLGKPQFSLRQVLESQTSAETEGGDKEW